VSPLPRISGAAATHSGAVTTGKATPVVLSLATSRQFRMGCGPRSVPGPQEHRRSVRGGGRQVAFAGVPGQRVAPEADRDTVDEAVGEITVEPVFPVGAGAGHVVIAGARGVRSDVVQDGAEGAADARGSSGGVLRMSQCGQVGRCHADQLGGLFGPVAAQVGVPRLLGDGGGHECGEGSVVVLARSQTVRY